VGGYRCGILLNQLIQIFITATDKKIPQKWGICWLRVPAPLYRCGRFVYLIWLQTRSRICFVKLSGNAT